MRNIFIGMLLVFLNFNIDIGSSRIGLIPTFLGYIYMLKGTSELLTFSGRFLKVRPYIIIMAIYHGILYATDIFGITPMIAEPIGFVLGLLSTILYFVILYYIVMGIKDIESLRDQSLNGYKLYSAWKLLVVFTISAYLLIFIPLLAVVSMIAGFIVVIYYLYIFYQAKNLFYEQNY